MATIKILDQNHVSPSTTSSSDPVVPLTFFDIAWLHTGPVERLFFFPYNNSTSHFLSTSLPSLTSSLSLTLQRFHLLTCHVTTSPSDPAQYIFSPSSSNSIALTVAESDGSIDFEEIVSSDPRDLSKLDPLVPQLGKSDDGTAALAALQITIFPNQGICIGVSIHHVVCDDSASIHFVKSWAAACRDNGFDSESAPVPPIHDRAVVPDPNGLYFKSLSEMRELASNGPPPPPPDLSIKPPALLMATFSLSRDQIDTLKHGVAETAASSGVLVHSSSFTVACAYAWICLLKCRGENPTKETAHLLFSVDCRARLTPPVPVQYFGNCLRPCFVEATVKDLLSENGVVSGAIEIGKSIKGLENGVLDGAELWLKKILSILPNQPMSIGGSPRFRVYDVDFGFGKPNKVEMLSIAKTPGTVSLSESGAEEGGIEIGVVLPRDEIERFSSCFLGGLKLI
ncbi:HXXXD-type acyl-transferase family protein [Rhynchospora pubera]|uniref:HXXXD-type acyl-transferase family protein n=1 Tax=Rhynchospora pubera TaxID=906938 RepID=A0AAV8EJ37_9POAL|nr:HXXXD-type acyl-transferase family protein [Rhynchospora pubera]